MTALEDSFTNAQIDTIGRVIYNYGLTPGLDGWSVKDTLARCVVFGATQVRVYAVDKDGKLMVQERLMTGSWSYLEGVKYRAIYMAQPGKRDDVLAVKVEGFTSETDARDHIEAFRDSVVGKVVVQRGATELIDMPFSTPITGAVLEAYSDLDGFDYPMQSQEV